MPKKPENPRKRVTASKPPVPSVLVARAAPSATPPATVPKRKTKATLLREMLEAPAGASAQSIMAATGWQAHTVRAALSGLRKSGCVLDRSTGPDGTVYVIVRADLCAPAASTSPGNVKDGTGVGHDPVKDARPRDSRPHNEAASAIEAGRSSHPDPAVTSKDTTTEIEPRS